MGILTIIGIAIGLSMDALAVSATNGALICDIRIRQALRIAFFFGLFQAVMPVLGWLAGLSFSHSIQRADHWIAFGLLAIIGGRMIHESLSKKPNRARNCLNFTTLILMSIATSIDALAIGLSFAMLEIDIWLPVIIIGAVTFLISMIGIRIGKMVGPFFGKRVELFGGLILIGIGIKIVIEHLVQGI